MPDLRTTLTELITGLAMVGHDTVDEALAARPAAMVSVSPELWVRLDAAHAGGAHRDDVDAAWANGRAFLAARDGLRGRRPLTVEWKGSQRAPGDEVAPIDLRIDHVYLVSCKYLSRIVVNASPARLFDRLLQGAHGARSADWYEEVAPDEHHQLYDVVRTGLADPTLPRRVDELSPAERKALGRRLREGWPAGAGEAYEVMTDAVARATAARWRDTIGGRAGQEAMLWRMLRIGSAPYFVLGAGRDGPIRRRILTPWDWRQRYRLRSLTIEAQAGGQARVGWAAEIDDRVTGADRQVCGHVEIRWSHGRLAAPPEAKVYLDTPHDDVPGYEPLV
ncbi:MAG: hypothetical protein S0880_02065 [Actinomycetota bacterium]|nr:hypothetical protein [Actinomycetota bacterium]